MAVGGKSFAPGRSAESEIVLSVEGVSKQFGGTQALDNVSLELERGRVLAMLGENGAGKSTLIKILAGVHTPDEGTILYRGARTTASQLPIAFIHQDLGLVDWMTVAENVCLSLGYPKRAGLIDFRTMRRRAVQALDQLGVVIDPDARIEQLTRTEKALVAVSRALGSDAEIVVMDEPTASSSGQRGCAPVRGDCGASQRWRRPHAGDRAPAVLCVQIDAAANRHVPFVVTGRSRGTSRRGISLPVARRPQKDVR